MSNKKNLIFVSGTGRSGTHLIGRTISSHDAIEGRIETSNTFGPITRIATTQDFNPSWLTFLYKLVLKSRLNKVIKSTDKIVLEKSHPSLWLVDYFIKTFDAKFVFIYRDVEPTVSSMLEHGGVLTWYDKLPQDKPNRFLGITKENASTFDNLSIEEKCALRWQSHYNEIFALNKKYPDRTFVMKYDEFLVNPEPILEKIAAFIGIPNTFNPEKFKVDSLDKWKNLLSEEQVKKIHAMVK